MLLKEKRSIKLVKGIHSIRIHRYKHNKIYDIEMGTDFMCIILQHWRHKHIKLALTSSCNAGETLEFSMDDKKVLCIFIPQAIFKKYSLDDWCFVRHDKYESHLLFKKKTREEIEEDG